MALLPSIYDGHNAPRNPKRLLSCIAYDVFRSISSECLGVRTALQIAAFELAQAALIIDCEARVSTGSAQSVSEGYRQETPTECPGSQTQSASQPDRPLSGCLSSLILRTSQQRY